MHDLALVRRLLPAPGGAREPAAALEDFDPNALAPAARPHLALNMVGSLDGAASLDGRSRGLSSDADRALFHALRARFDAVMVGGATLRVERYGPIIPGAAVQPICVIASARLDFDPALPVFADPSSRVVVLTPSAGELAPCRASVSYVRGNSFPAMLKQLREEHGVRSLLCEGGPTLNGLLLSDGVVDELFLSLAPMLLGEAGGPHIVAGNLQTAVQLELRWLLEAEGHLLARYAVVSRVSSATTSSSSLAS